jgi:hypothetical protein
MSLTTDKPQAHPVLEDTSDSSGVPLAKALEGETTTAKNAQGALVAKDAAGNFRYMKVNAQDELIVDTETSEVACLNGTAKVTGGTSEQTIFDIVLVAGREYRKLGWSVSNFRQTEYRFLHIDDPGGTPTETELLTVLVAPGDVNDSSELECISFTAGATGPVLRVVGTNKDAASDLRATASILEVV